MTIFKTYFKIVKANAIWIFLWIAITIGITVLNLSVNKKNTDSFKDFKPKLAVIDEDKTSLSKNLTSYLEGKSKLIKVENDKTKIQDALFSNDASVIFIIPKHFSKDFMENKNPQIIKKVASETPGVYAESLVNKYLNNYKIYIDLGYSDEEANKLVISDLNTHVDIKKYQKGKDMANLIAIYYNFIAYTMLSITIIGIGNIIITFNKKNIKNRTLISGTKASKLNFNLFLANTIFALTIWIIYIIVSLVIFKGEVINDLGKWFIINSLFYTLAAASMSQLLGLCTDSVEIISALSTVIPLALAFISGTFIPAEVINKNILNFSKISPMYWYINNCNKISNISSFNSKEIKPLLMNIYLMLGFAFVFLLLSLIIYKHKSKLD